MIKVWRRSFPVASVNITIPGFLFTNKLGYNPLIYKPLMIQTVYDSDPKRNMDDVLVVPCDENMAPFHCVLSHSQFWPHTVIG